MPFTTEEYDHILLAILNATELKITRELCGKISDSMDGKIGSEKIRQHLYKLKRETSSKDTPSKAKATNGKKQTDGDSEAAVNGSPTKARTPTRKRAATKSKAPDGDESPKKVKKEMDTEFGGSFLDQDKNEI
ncbi:hypothetical protein UCRNP2_6560 [Neofusicoccum parvum UCRNP2]|uniref:Uncharacterized protein n=1 Tax=Botryosphaeria parva (strain UCR-NP2) TaxID=1287680 RepID=R1GEK7_BOTPV|nr:hypothetical protein UCRNP2_6560 [Neofusicoccum parvum UCRNP2]